MAHSTRKLNTTEFIKKSKIIHGDNYDYSLVDYSTSHIKVKIKCKKCNSVFTQKPNNHLSGQRCPDCFGNKTSTTKLFIEKANKIHNNKFDYSQVVYKNAHTNVKIICKIHGIFEITPNAHLNKRSRTLNGGCVKCGITNKSNTEEFIKKAIKVHGNLYNYDKFEYSLSINKSLILCNKNGHGYFLQGPTQHLAGKGCPKCCDSKGELYISEWLNKNNFKNIREYTFDECKDIHKLKFDFYLPDVNICIEYDGIQHFIPINYWGGPDGLNKIKHRDSIKNNYCKINKIKLLRISYLDFKKIDSILKQYLL